MLVACLGEIEGAAEVHALLIAVITSRACRMFTLRVATDCDAFICYSARPCFDREFFALDQKVYVLNNDCIT